MPLGDARDFHTISMSLLTYAKIR